MSTTEMYGPYGALILEQAKKQADEVQKQAKLEVQKQADEVQKQAKLEAKKQADEVQKQA